MEEFIKIPNDYENQVENDKEQLTSNNDIISYEKSSDDIYYNLVRDKKNENN